MLHIKTSKSFPHTHTLHFHSISLRTRENVPKTIAVMLARKHKKQVMESARQCALIWELMSSCWQRANLHMKKQVISLHSPMVGNQVHPDKLNSFHAMLCWSVHAAHKNKQIITTHTHTHFTSILYLCAQGGMFQRQSLSCWQGNTKKKTLKVHAIANLLRN